MQIDKFHSIVLPQNLYERKEGTSMKVSQLPYRRVTLEETREVLENIISRIEKAQTVREVLDARQDYLKFDLELTTSQNLAYMRYSINTADAFYVAENDYYDEAGPAIYALQTRYASALLDSPFRPELEKALNPLVFKTMEVQRKAMAPEIVEDMAEENRLISEYSKLMAAMEFEFRGEKMPRSMLAKYFKDPDRSIRKAAMEAMGRTLEENAQALDDIFDRMVHVRDRMAKKMGCKNFVELGYYRMGRLNYGEEEVKTFRENVLRDIVPVVARLRTANAKRLGIDDFMFYDNEVIIPGGDPVPLGKAEIFSAAEHMYHAMGDETGAFIDKMLENEAFDVDSRKNKWGGGYCTEFPKYKQPFILANFNGTAGDVDVVTHEAGHALNAYLIADNPYSQELGCGGMETAETHSMGMEFFTWPYMDKFFGQDAAKYRYMHALSALSFIPYGTMVDAFQHIVYENPDLSPAERKAEWRKLERAFRPHIGFEGIPYLEEGTRWQYQMHIYESPFYYIDYCLAQTAALGFLLASQADYADAFRRYIRLSKTGGEKLWTDLLEEAGLPSPFTPGALQELAGKVEALLEKIQV